MKALKSTFRSAILLVMSVSLFSSCSKEEGEGGAASITGKVMIQDINKTTDQEMGNPYEAPDEKVYIIYGSGTTYDDDFNTSYDGSFKFNYLRTGTYKVFVYSDIVPEPTSGPKQEAIVTTVEITDKKSTTEIPTVTINKYN